jgi:hypothetical protein
MKLEGLDLSKPGAFEDFYPIHVVHPRHMSFVSKSVYDAVVALEKIDTRLGDLNSCWKYKEREEIYAARPSPWEMANRLIDEDPKVKSILGRTLEFAFHISDLIERSFWASKLSSLDDGDPESYADDEDWKLYKTVMDLDSEELSGESPAERSRFELEACQQDLDVWKESNKIADDVDLIQSVSIGGPSSRREGKDYPVNDAEGDGFAKIHFETDDNGIPTFDLNTEDEEGRSCTLASSHISPLIAFYRAGLLTTLEAFRAETEKPIYALPPGNYANRLRLMNGRPFHPVTMPLHFLLEDLEPGLFPEEQELSNSLT